MPTNYTKIPLKFVLWGFLRLIRVVNLVIMMLTQYIAKIMLLNYTDEAFSIDFRFVLLMFSTVCVGAAGYIINDYYDMKIDIINKPKKMVIGRILRRRTAIIWNVSLNFLGLLAAFFLGKSIFLFVFFTIFFLWLYSNKLKRTAFVGNFVVACLSASGLLIVGVFEGIYSLEIWFYVVFAFLVSLVREIIKDIEDMKGDKIVGANTLPIVLGIPKTRVFLYFVISLFVVGIVVGFFFFSKWRIIFLLAINLPLLVWLIMNLRRADKKKDFSQMSLICKIMMVFGVFSMLL